MSKEHSWADLTALLFDENGAMRLMQEREYIGLPCKKDKQPSGP